MQQQSVIMLSCIGCHKHYAAPQQQATEPAYCHKCVILASLGFAATAAKQQRKTAATAITAAIDRFKNWQILAFTADFLAAELPQISRRFISDFLCGMELRYYNGTTAYYILQPQQQQNNSAKQQPQQQNNSAKQQPQQ